MEAGKLGGAQLNMRTWIGEAALDGSYIAGIASRRQVLLAIAYPSSYRRLKRSLYMSALNYRLPDCISSKVRHRGGQETSIYRCQNVKR